MSNRKALIIAVVVSMGLIVLLMVACAGTLFLGFKKSDAVVSPRIDALFDAMADGTFAETYETETTSELRSSMSKEKYTALGEAMALRLGDLESKSLRSFKMRQRNASSYIEVSYAAKFENGPGTIFAQMKKEGDAWMFRNFFVRSTLLDKEMTTGICPSCGVSHSLEARFCPSCGEKLAEGSSQKPSPSETVPLDAASE